MSIDDKNMSVFFELLTETIGENSSKSLNFKKLERIPLNNNECIFVIDFSQNKVIYNRGFKNFLGYEENEISTDFLTNLHHPDDLEMVNRIVKASILHCLTFPEDSYKNILLTSFRIRKKDGTYIKILNKSSIYKADKDGKIISTFNKIIDISFMDNSLNVSWDFKASNLNVKLFKQQIYEIHNDFFTERETEIIAEIDKVKSSAEIADKLNISIHTVATHRKQIYKKCDCHNPVELIKFSQGIGII